MPGPVNGCILIPHLAPVHEHLELSLYHVNQTLYTSLHVQDHTHTHWALSFVSEGRVEIFSRGERFVAEAGSVMVHPPRVVYSEFARSPGVNEWILVDARLPPYLDLLHLYPVAPVVAITDPEDYSKTFARLRDAWDDQTTPFREIRLHALTTELIHRILESWQVGGCVPRPPALQTARDRFAGLINFMNLHLEEKLSRADLARQTNLHPNYFDKTFTEAYGMPPMAMLREMRLRRARRLLENTDLTLEVIADRSGMGRASYLARVFAQRFGQTAGEYRESVKSATTPYRSGLQT